MLSSFVSHKHGPSLLPCFSLSLFLSTPLICFYLRPAVPTAMIGVFTPLPTRCPTAGSQRQWRGGLSSQPHCWFSTGKLHHSSTHSLPSLPRQPLAAPLFLLFLLTSLFLSLWVWQFASGHGSTLGVRCSPCKHFHPAPSSCFDSFRCSSVLRCGLGVDSAIWPDVWNYAAKSRARVLIGQGGREQESADGGVPGARRRQCSWLRQSFAGCHGGQVADSLFLPLRNWQLGAHGAGAVRGRGQLREAGELWDQPEGRRDGGRDWEERKWWVDSAFVDELWQPPTL